MSRRSDVAMPARSSSRLPGASGLRPLRGRGRRPWGPVPSGLRWARRRGSRGERLARRHTRRDNRSMAIDWSRSTRRCSALDLLLAVDLIASGANRILDPEPFVAVSASRRSGVVLRHDRVMARAVGAIELLSGVALLPSRSRRPAAAVAAVVLIALVPDNLRAARMGGYPGMSGPAGSRTASWSRIVLGPVLALAAARTALTGPAARRGKCPTSAHT